MSDAFTSDTYNALCSEAEGYISRGLTEQARELLLKAVSLIATRPRARSLLADACMALGLWSEAREQLEVLTTLEIESIQHHLRLGQVLEELGDYPQARDNYSVVVDREPGNRIATVALGRLAGKSRTPLAEVQEEPARHVPSSLAMRPDAQIFPDAPGAEDVFATTDDVDSLLKDIGVAPGAGDEREGDVSALLSRVGISLEPAVKPEPVEEKPVIKDISEFIGKGARKQTPPPEPVPESPLEALFSPPPDREEPVTEATPGQEGGHATLYSIFGEQQKAEAPGGTPGIQTDESFLLESLFGQSPAAEVEIPSEPAAPAAEVSKEELFNSIFGPASEKRDAEPEPPAAAPEPGGTQPEAPVEAAAVDAAGGPSPEAAREQAVETVEEPVVRPVVEPAGAHAGPVPDALTEALDTRVEAAAGPAPEPAAASLDALAEAFASPVEITAAAVEAVADAVAEPAMKEAAGKAVEQAGEAAAPPAAAEAAEPPEPVADALAEAFGVPADEASPEAPPVLAGIEPPQQPSGQVPTLEVVFESFAAAPPEIRSAEAQSASVQEPASEPAPAAVPVQEERPGPVPAPEPVTAPGPVPVAALEPCIPSVEAASVVAAVVPAVSGTPDQVGVEPGPVPAPAPGPVPGPSGAPVGEYRIHKPDPDELVLVELRSGKVDIRMAYVVSLDGDLSIEKEGPRRVVSGSGLILLGQGTRVPVVVRLSEGSLVRTDRLALLDSRTVLTEGAVESIPALARVASGPCEAVLFAGGRFRELRMDGDRISVRSGCILCAETGVTVSEDPASTDFLTVEGSGRVVLAL